MYIPKINIDDTTIHITYITIPSLQSYSPRYSGDLRIAKLRYKATQEDIPLSNDIGCVIIGTKEDDVEFYYG
jgi:hypothetical protein